MKTVLKICGICLVSAACSTFSDGGEQSFTGEMQRWLGRPEGQLYQVWGAPANVYNVTPQEKVLTYVRTSSRGRRNPYGNEIYYDGTGEAHWWDEIFGPPAQNQPQQYYCKISFVVRRGIIVNYNFNGDNCVVNN